MTEEEKKEYEAALEEIDNRMRIFTFGLDTGKDNDMWAETIMIPKKYHERLIEKIHELEEENKRLKEDLEYSQSIEDPVMGAVSTLNTLFSDSYIERQHKVGIPIDEGKIVDFKDL